MQVTHESCPVPSGSSSELSGEGKTPPDWPNPVAQENEESHSQDVELIHTVICVGEIHRGYRVGTAKCMISRLLKECKADSNFIGAQTEMPEQPEPRIKEQIEGNVVDTRLRSEQQSKDTMSKSRESC